MSDDDSGNEYEVGYRRPPKSTRFQKGQRANPKGRPAGRSNDVPYEAVLGQKVTIREDGSERQVTAAEAFLLHLTKQALAGNSAAARTAMSAIEAAKAIRQPHYGILHTWIRVIVTPGSVNSALEPLRMARKLDRYRETARMALEPWIVEAALARLGNGRLTRKQQETVMRATRTPNKVRWPDWWTMK
ncbi:MAG: hypothetical protein KDK07_15915 [Bauldia sp.]|nr:hypothetical protein [Bauldia sp.]